MHTTQTGWDPTKFSVMQVFKNIVDRLHPCNHRCSFLNVFKLDKVSKVGQGDFNFSSHQQSVQNFKLEAASLMANGQIFLQNINDKDFCKASMTKGKLFSLEMHFKQAIWGQTIFYVSGILWWNFDFKIRRCDCVFPATSNTIWFQETCTFEIVNFVVLDSCITWLCNTSVYFRKNIRCLWIPWVSAGGFWGEMAADSGKMDSTESQFNNTSTISHHHHHHLVRFQIFLWCLIFFLWCLSQNTAGDKGQDGFNRISIQQHSPA